MSNPLLFAAIFLAALDSSSNPKEKKCFEIGVKLGNDLTQLENYALEIQSLEKVGAYEIAGINEMVEEIKRDLKKAVETGCIESKEASFIENQLSLFLEALRRSDWRKVWDHIRDVREAVVLKAARRR
jgi:hypothetical protein